MDLGNRGDIGFPEAMVATAAVCIIAVAFVSFASSVMDADAPAGPDTDWRFLKGISIEDGRYALDPGCAEAVLAEGGCRGVRMILDPMGAGGVPAEEVSAGDASGDRASSRRIACIPSDSGRRIPTLCIVEVFR